MLSDIAALSAANATSTMIGVGFGTAALGASCYEVVLEALSAGFRAFDTAEEKDWWYNQKAVGAALEEYFTNQQQQEQEVLTDDECILMDTSEEEGPVCMGQSTSSCRDLRISTKIPPWELTSSDHIRDNAAKSRQELVGFCDDTDADVGPLPLDVYYIHAPACWKGWHPKCDNPPQTMDLRSVWLALESVVGLDHSARRIGLSNVHPPQLLDIIQFTKERQAQQQQQPGLAAPRLPDVVQIYADPIRPAEEMRQICREHGIEFVSYSTLGTQHRMAGNPVLGSPIVQALAAKHHRSTAEVVLSWALQNGMSVIPRSSQRQHIRELARLLRRTDDDAAAGFLDADDLLQMDSMKDTA